MLLSAYNRMGFLGVLPISGVSKERVTLWSGCIGLTALAGFSGQRPEWDGATPSPSGEPTTTKAERVVIVGYINGKPLSANSSLRLPLSSVREVFHHRCRLEMHRPAQGLNRLSVFAGRDSSLSSAGGFSQPQPSGWRYSSLCPPVSER